MIKGFFFMANTSSCFFVFPVPCSGLDASMPKHASIHEKCVCEHVQHVYNVCVHVSMHACIYFRKEDIASTLPVVCVGCVCVCQDVLLCLHVRRSNRMGL